MATWFHYAPLTARAEGPTTRRRRDSPPQREPSGSSKATVSMAGDGSMSWVPGRLGATVPDLATVPPYLLGPDAPILAVTERARAPRSLVGKDIRGASRLVASCRQHCSGSRSSGSPGCHSEARSNPATKPRHPRSSAHYPPLSPVASRTFVPWHGPARTRSHGWQQPSGYLHPSTCAFARKRGLGRSLPICSSSRRSPTSWTTSLRCNRLSGRPGDQASGSLHLD